MKFAIVEIKESLKDTYVIYDMENKGVCCCSSYTIKQLIENNHTVYGAKYNDNGRLKISEVDLQGNLRTKKTGIICKDTTKRSMVTITKGLDEKHYPREVKTKRGNGSCVSIQIKSKDNKKFRLNNLCGCSHEYDEFKETGIQVSNGNIITSNGTVISAEFIKEINVKKAVFSSQIKVAEVEEEERKLLEYMYCIYEGILEQNRLITQKSDKIDKQLAELELEQARLKKEQKNLLDKNFNEKEEKKKFLYDECMKYQYRDLTGEELVKYSFHSKYSTVSKEYIQVLLEKTSRPILYTLGYKWKNPTTQDVKITNEKALKILKNETLIDIDATNSDVIYMNEYSGNDMW